MSDSKLEKTIKELDAPTTPDDNEETRRSWRDPRLSLVGFLSAALLAACLVVGVGHMIYLRSSGYKLDITRPGLKDIKKGELVEVDRSQSYDSTSPIDRAVLDAEIKSIGTRQQELDRYGDFADDELSRMQDRMLQEETLGPDL